MADPINILSVCSGGGGLDAGLRLALPGSRVVAYVDRDAYAAATLLEGMESGWLDRAPVLCDDLALLDTAGAADRLGGIVGGYPCQPFSHAGKRGGAADARHLWPVIHRVVAETLPGFCFFENVRGHLTLGFGEVVESLERLGYRVVAGLVSAEECGAPHKRERLFILAVLADCAGRGRGIVRESSGGDGLADGGDAQLADAQDANGRVGVAGVAGVAGERWGGLGRDGAGVAYARGERSQWIVEGGSAPGATGRGRGAEVSMFPPGPADLDRWRRILTERPDLAPSLEPGVRGVADGLAHRVHRLRVLGNGCVPLAVGYAFTALWACATGGE